MKKIINFIIVLILMFLISNNNVNAGGICTGDSLGDINDGTYCKTGKTVKFTKVTDKYAYFLPVGFTATVTDNGKTYNGVAFCLDPALLSPPDTKYEYVRELNINDNTKVATYDKKVYAMYQWLVDATVWAENNGNAEVVKLYRALFEAALRIHTYNYGWAYLRYSSTGIVKAFHDTDGKNFENCVKKYIEKKSDVSIDAKYATCFGQDAYIGEENYITLIEKIRNSDIRWNNPLNDESIFEDAVLEGPTETNSNYKITFKINSNFSTFFSQYSGQLESLNLNAASFEAYIAINGVNCSGTNCDASISNNVNGGKSIVLNNYISSSSLNFVVEMTPEQYNSFILGGGVVELKYKYNHPMDVNNLYFARTSEKTSYTINSKQYSNLDYQRMLSIYNSVTTGSKVYSATGIVNICEIKNENGKNVYYDSTGRLGTGKDNLIKYHNSCGCTTELASTYDMMSNTEKIEYNNNLCHVPSPTCEFVTSGGIISEYKDDLGDSSDITGFIDSCGCELVENAINSGISITEEDKSIYNVNCTTISKTYSTNLKSNLNKCIVDYDNVENYEILYEENEKSNKYVKKKCVETIKFLNVPGHFKNLSNGVSTDIKAGTYLELYSNTSSKKLSMNAEKNCTIEFDYKTWLKDYTSKLNTLINTYNNLNKWESLSNSGGTGNTCNDGADEYELWEGSYTKYKKEGSGTNINITYSDESFSRTICSNKTTVDDKIDKYEEKLEDKYEALIEHLQLLKDIDDLLNASDYYQLKNDLKFYYDQNVYSSNSLISNVDTLAFSNSSLELSSDSKTVMDMSTNVYSSDETELEFKYINIENYTSPIESEYITFPTFSGSTVNKYKFSRVATISGYYSSSKPKLAKSYTGLIEEYETLPSSKVIINLGYNVYGIYEDAKASTNNSYFEFTSLGDNNQIYEYITSGKKITDYSGMLRDATNDDLKRVCDYKIINNILCIPGTDELECDSGKVSSKILFKIVDTDNIDPNNRRGDDNDANGMVNWIGKDTLIEDYIQKEDTFNPDNLEYSFDLSSSVISSIREYNDKTNYNDYVGYECDLDGNFCKSSFINAITNVSGGTVYGDTFVHTFNKFGEIVSGRSQWTYYKSDTDEVLVEDHSAT